MQHTWIKRIGGTVAALLLPPPAAWLVLRAKG